MADQRTRAGGPVRGASHLAAFVAGALLASTLLLLLALRDSYMGPGTPVWRIWPSAAIPQPAQPHQHQHAAAAVPEPLASHIRRWRRPGPLSLPWEPLLSPSQLKRGLGYYGSGKRIERVVAALMAEQPITAVVIGGSVSRGAGSSTKDRAFPARFFSFLNATFPHSGHVFLNKAIGGTNSGIYATCAEQIVPPETDLVVAEFTFNEKPDLPMNNSERMGFEQMLRKLARLPRAPAVIVLHHYAWWFAVGDGLKGGLFYRPAEMQLSTVAQFYDMPSPSVRNALYHAMRADMAPFKVTRVHQDNVLSLAQERLNTTTEQSENYFYYDAIHPSDTGHQVLAELLAGVIQTAAHAVAEAATAGEDPLADAVAAGNSGTQLNATRQSTELPQPMIPGNAAHATSLCAMQEDFKPLAVATQGFEYLPERPTAVDFVSQKWGWRGNRIGAWVELLLSTEEAPGQRGNATVILGYLRSYEGMGRARVECRSGCTCSPTEVEGLWEQRTSLVQLMHTLVSQHPECRIRVTIVDWPAGKLPPGAGAKFQLVAAMVATVPIGIPSSQHNNLIT